MAVQYKPTDKLSFVIANDYRLLQVMSRFGISFGFGEKIIQDVCRQCGVDTDTFLTVINYVKDGAEDRLQKVDHVSVKSLLGYLRKTHIYFLEYQLPAMRRHLLSSIDCSVKNEIAFIVLKFFDEYVDEVRKHMEYEENKVFTYVEKLLEGGTTTIDGMHTLSSHHDSVDGKLNELKNLFMQYYPQKENNNELNSVVIDIYQTAEDLSIHCLVEDNIFIPAVKRLEHQNRQRRTVEETGNGEMEQPAGDEQLSEREKQIVICVAKGMANKEIAEELCLSVNTVTTHRRNIARKLQIHSSAGITIYAIVNKLVTLDEVNV
ncbi:MAG: LuxR C-terminal-related transcriptional regulator [Bacteroides sp.]|nr:LuxR C-terminal-related transcriptional regulator [Roseburia sp.]MCM1346249.1 LuxR C-terminal-related transcriptional regulator [Bacteroides sp.]MCM1420822.1 LuxR C-terminal-related transcriptional regulator [Bacteroides sp.]